MKIHTHLHEDVISEILDLGQLCHGEGNVAKVLDQLVEKISRIMQTDVCSLYLLNPHTRELVLKATKGLNKESVDQVKMKISEGLVGKAVEWLKPVSMATGRKSKSYKHFPNTGEEQFSSFLAVPLIYNRSPIGSLVVQNKTPKKFSAQSIHFLMSLTIPAISVIEKAKLLGTFAQITSKEDPLLSLQNENQKTLKRHKGILHTGVGASPGIALAPVKISLKHVSRSPRVERKAPLHREVEKMRILEAFRWVEEEIRETRKKAKRKFGLEELSIFDAYQMVLESEPLKEQISNEIEKGKSALESIELVVARYTEELSLAEDEYLRERAYDIQDVGRKITDHLIYGSENPLSAHVLEKDAIILSDYWSISDFVEMDLEKTKAILSPVGGASSHIAILAKSLGIPAVLGLSRFTDLIQDDDFLIVDGSSGVVIVNPESETIKVYEYEIKQNALAMEEYIKSACKPAKPRYGKRITIGANMGMVAYAGQALENGAEEIGLYRTELPFMIRRSLPTEEEQYNLYTRVIKAMKGNPVTFRTLDLGGDKYIPYLNIPHEANPFLGWRSIRISLDREDLFRIQLRALLRASSKGKIRLLFPMICSLEEIRRVKEILRDVKKELKAQKISYASSIPVGIMIEVPSAAEMADSLIKEVQFFSIGTNDLVQYTLAVDRNNAKVAKLYNPLHPAVLRLIIRTIETAHKHKKQVSVCGEMASHPLGVVLLVGMGVDSLSMSVPMIAKIKSLICHMDLNRVQSLTRHVLKMETVKDITQSIEAFYKAEGLESYLPHPAPITYS